MKTVRLNVLCSPKFKERLVADANKAGISVSELVRRRCQRTPSDEEELLADMAAELRKATAQARITVDAGLRAVSEAPGQRSSCCRYLPLCLRCDVPGFPKNLRPNP